MKRVISYAIGVMVIGIILPAMCQTAAHADEKTGGPKRGVFPEEGAGIHVHGDLVISDPVNRRGALREKTTSQRHCFAMLH